jgi:hypothetical protein
VARFVVQITREAPAFGFLHFDHLTTQLINGALVGVSAKMQLLMIEARRYLRRQRFQRAEIIDLESFRTARIGNVEYAARTFRERHRHTDETAGQIPSVAVAGPDVALVDEECALFKRDGTGHRFAQPDADALGDWPGYPGCRDDREQPILRRRQEERSPAAIGQSRGKIDRDGRQTMWISCNDIMRLQPRRECGFRSKRLFDQCRHRPQRDVNGFRSARPVTKVSVHFNHVFEERDHHGEHNGRSR